VKLWMRSLSRSVASRDPVCLVLLLMSVHPIQCFVNWHELERNHLLQVRATTTMSGDITAAQAPRSSGKLAPGVLGINAGAALAALDLLELPLSSEMIATAVANLNLHGRRERHTLGQIDVIFDVAHNADAIAKLREFLDESVVSQPTVAVFGVMSDKDCYSMISTLDGGL